jgi:hypothetical protein
VLYLESHEPGFTVNRYYLKLQKELTSKARFFLLKYIYKLCTKYDLKRSTFALAVFYFDKFMENQPVAGDGAILSAVQAACFIAMKYEEIYPPSLDMWVGVRNRQMVLSMECEMLASLDFKLAHFTMQHFY